MTGESNMDEKELDIKPEDVMATILSRVPQDKLGALVKAKGWDWVTAIAFASEVQESNLSAVVKAYVLNLIGEKIGKLDGIMKGHDNAGNA